MSYLTEYYKNKCKTLQERYDYLFSILNEDMPEGAKAKILKFTDAQFEGWLQSNVPSDELRQKFRKMRADAAPKSSSPPPSGRSRGPTPPPSGGSRGPTPPPPPPPSGGSRGPTPPPSGGSRGPTPPPPPPSGGSRGPTPPPPPPPPSGGSRGPTPSPSVPPRNPGAGIPPRHSASQRAASSGGAGWKGRVTGFGAGLVTGYAADVATRKALEAAGVENETIKDVAGMAAGTGVGAATDIATVSALSGAGAAAAGVAGAAALLPFAAAGGVGAIAGKGLEKLGDIEYKLPGEKGNAKSTLERLGRGMYETNPIVKGVTNLIAGNKLTAGTGDLNEKPKGVAGGDPARLAQIEAEEREEEERVKRNERERNARIAAMAAKMRAGEEV